MVTKPSLDFGLRTAPDSWHAAAEEAPEGDPLPLRRKRYVGSVPVSTQVDLITSSLAALAMSVVFGTFWYLIETDDGTRDPWFAVGLGVLIAIAVRLGGGRDHADTRAMVSVLFYLSTILVVAYMVERHYNLQLWGSNGSLAGSEQNLVRYRLTDPETLGAWCFGLAATVQVSYLLRRFSGR